MTAWITTQAVHGSKQGFAQGLQIPEANVRCITQYMGGGFGSKFGPDAQGLICAKLAKQAKLPVKLMLDRKEEHLDTGNRPSASAHIRAGVTADGTPADAGRASGGRREGLIASAASSAAVSAEVPPAPAVAESLMPVPVAATASSSPNASAVLSPGLKR